MICTDSNPRIFPALALPRPGRRRLGAFVGSAALLALLSCGQALADPAGEAGPIDGMMQHLTNGRGRSELFDAIERNETERARQKAEREAIEAEVRAITADIDDAIFAIRLNLAEFRNGPSACRQRRDRAATLAAQAADFERLADSARARCRKAGLDAPSVAQLCRTRLDEIDRQKASIAAEQAAASEACAGTEGGKR